MWHARLWRCKDDARQDLNRTGSSTSLPSTISSPCMLSIFRYYKTIQNNAVLTRAIGKLHDGADFCRARPGVLKRRICVDMCFHPEATNDVHF